MDFLLGSDFKGGMNSDDENRTIPKGEYRTALNIRNGLSDTESQECVTNVLGNVIGPVAQCPYSTTGVMPVGNSHAIGQFEDTLNNSVIFMVWNVNGNHGIYRYYPAQNVTYQIIQYNFGWQPGERITSISLIPGKSGQLLYWCDSQGLRNINLDRAVIVNKQKSWKIYFPQTNIFTTNTFPTLVLKDINNVQILNAQIALGPYANNSDGLQAWATYLNQHFSAIITAVACDCHVEITEVKTNSFYFSCTGGFNVPFPVVMVPDNWYGSTLGDILFARAVAPSLWPPKLTYQADATYPANLVKNHVFQGAIQLYFSDYQQSVLSVASQIPINNLQCDGTNNLLLNYVDIDFNNSDFIANLVLWLTVIDQVAVIVREHNDGIWNTVEILTPCDFLDWNGTAFFLHYKFYNDDVVTAVDAETSTALNSGVPITADSEATVFNRIVSGGITTDRDAPDCVDASYNIKFTPTLQKQLFTIKANIRVMNPRMDLTNGSHLVPENQAPTALQQRSAIIYDSGLSTGGSTVYPMYGGSFYTSPGNAFTFNTDYAYNQKRQLLPEAGWPVYLAGLPQFGISKQINRQAVNQRLDGSIDITGGPTSASGMELLALYQNLNDNPGNANYDLYSVVEIPNVAPGTYVLRVANGLCSFGDVLTKGFMYDLNNPTGIQSTSAPVWGVYDANGTYKYDFELTVIVTNADVFAGTFLISDYVLPAAHYYNGQTGVLPSVSGYIFDNFGLIDVKSLSEGEVVEKTFVKSSAASVTETITMMQKITDHNGFYFLYALPGGASYLYFATATQVGNTSINDANSVLYFEIPTITGSSALFLLREQTIGTSIPTPIPSHVEAILPCNNTNARTNASTFLQGSVIDQNGASISLVSVLFQHTGRLLKTDINGKYDMLVWGDMSLGNNNNRVIDSLIFNLNLLCNGTYPNGQTVGPLQITPFGNAGYNPTNPVLVGAFTIDEIVFAINKAQKRGGKKIYGIVYYDIAGRVCSVSKGFEAYIPFETEDLSQYPTVINPATGVPYVGLTVLGGQPTLTWILDPSFKPPPYAAYYQWLWTLDGIYQTELQWVANSVQYVSAFANPIAGSPVIDTAFANGDYIGALINISNIASYLQTNPDSVIGYSYTAGDRLRLISDRNNVLLNTPGTYAYTQAIYDFEITGTDANGNLIIKLPLLPFEIKSGFTIEIYTPTIKTPTDVQLFYEVGEVFKCTNPGQTNNAHSVLTAQFTSGDTYWRGRLIQVADTITDYTATYPVIIEDPSVSDFYVSNDSDINPSRTGIINPYLKQIYYKDRLIVSDQFQEGSALNGLSFCDPTNISDLGAQYGNVARLIVVSKELYAIMRNNNVSNLIGVVSLNYAQETNTVEAISSDFLGTQRPSVANMGTDFPAALAHIDGYIYAPFTLRNAVWRHAQDGAIEISLNEYNTYVPGTPTSDTKTRTSNLFRQLFQGGNVWDAHAIYDKQYKEYILTVWQKGTATGIISPTTTNYLIDITGINPNFTAANIGDKIVVYYIDGVSGANVSASFMISGVIIGTAQIIITPLTPVNIKFNSSVSLNFRGQGSTIAWNETQKRWPKYYSFVPECYAALGNNLYAFQNGQLWVMDVNPIRNNFFGVQYTSQLTFVLNDEPKLVKSWQAFSLMQLQADGGNNWSCPTISNDRGQLSRFLKGAFRKLEEFWYAAFKRDLTDVTATNPILNGRPLKSSSLVMMLENDATVQFKLYQVGYNIAKSERTSS